MNLRKTEKLWRAWVLFLERLYARLRYTALPIGEVIGGIDHDGLQPLLWLSEYTSTDMPVGCPKTICEEERAFSQMVFGALGTTDLDGQLLHIEHCSARAEEMLEQAVAHRRKCEKAYTATGVCGGLCVGLLLL